MSTKNIQIEIKMSYLSKNTVSYEIYWKPIEKTTLVFFENILDRY